MASPTASMLTGATSSPPADSLLASPAAALLPSISSVGVGRRRERTGGSSLMGSMAAAGSAGGALAKLTLQQAGAAKKVGRVLTKQRTSRGSCGDGGKGGGSGKMADSVANEAEVMHAKLERAIRIARSYGDEMFDAVLAREMAREEQQQTDQKQLADHAAMVSRLKNWGQMSYHQALDGLPYDYTQWDVTEVVAWARKCGFGADVGKLAAANHLDGHALSWMDADSVVDVLCGAGSAIGDNSETKRKAAHRALEYLKEQHTSRA